MAAPYIRWARLHKSNRAGGKDRPALFAYITTTADPGVVDFDWVHYQALGRNPW